MPRIGRGAVTTVGEELWNGFISGLELRTDWGHRATWESRPPAQLVATCPLQAEARLAGLPPTLPFGARTPEGVLGMC